MGCRFVTTLLSSSDTTANMNSLILTLAFTLAVAHAAPSGLGYGLGLGLGWGHAGPGAILVPPVAGAIISKPIDLFGAPIAPIAPVIAPVAAPIIAPASAVAVTNGGGVVGVSGHGAVVSGPKTAPVVIDGPSGTIKADGLWGPTLAGVAAPAGHGW